MTLRPKGKDGKQIKINLKKGKINETVCDVIC